MKLLALTLAACVVSPLPEEAPKMGVESQAQSVAGLAWAKLRPGYTPGTQRLVAWAYIARGGNAMLRYRAGGEWHEAPAFYQTTLQDGRDVWFAESDDLSFTAVVEGEIASAAFSLSWDDGFVLGAAPVALRGEHRGTLDIAGRNDLSFVRVVYSSDAWSTVVSVDAERVQPGLFRAVVPAEGTLVLAIESDRGWDNFFGRDHVLVRAHSLLGRFVSDEGFFDTTAHIGEPAARVVAQVGSVRPAPEVHFLDDTVAVGLPPQYEAGAEWLRLTVDAGATALGPPRIVEPIAFSRERDLLDESSWAPTLERESQWRFGPGTLDNLAYGANLVTNGLFTDFALHAEFRLPPGGNAGIFLRGRHELQLQDDAGLAPSSVRMGGLYGWIAPSTNRAAPAGTWQTLDLTLHGDVLSVWLDGVCVIDERVIPGVTGGALDRDTRAAGPLMLQGDHTAVSFRALRIRE